MILSLSVSFCGGNVAKSGFLLVRFQDIDCVWSCCSAGRGIVDCQGLSVCGTMSGEGEGSGPNHPQDVAALPVGEGQAETQPKVEKGEPLNVVVKDQHGHELHFKVRKTTKFEKVGTVKT